MDFKQFETAIAAWSDKIGLHEATNTDAQFAKLQEEVDELGEALKKFEYQAELLRSSEGLPAIDVGAAYDEILMEIGDCEVVLAGIARKLRTSLETCAWMAYNKIKDREGKIVNGTFVKKEDL